MDSKLSINGDVDVAINQNHGPITINYGGGNSGGGDEPPSGFVYFSDMTVDELKQCRRLSRQALNRARKEILFSVPVILLLAHFAALVFIMLNIVEFINLVKVFQEYMIILPVTLIATVHFLRRKADQYAPLISQYKGEIAGIEKELLHRRISSR